MPQKERLRVWKGELKKTSGGLTKKDLIKNKRGKIVSKKKSEHAVGDENNLGSWLRGKGDKFQGKPKGYKKDADDRASQTKSDRTLAVIGLTAGVALVGVGSYLFYRQANSGSNISSLDLTTDAHGRIAALPPAHFGSAPAYFPARR